MINELTPEQHEEIAANCRIEAYAIRESGYTGTGEDFEECARYFDGKALYHEIMGTQKRIVFGQDKSDEEGQLPNHVNSSPPLTGGGFLSMV